MELRAFRREHKFRDALDVPASLAGRVIHERPVFVRGILTEEDCSAGAIYRMHGVIRFGPLVEAHGAPRAKRGRRHVPRLGDIAVRIDKTVSKKN